MKTARSDSVSYGSQGVNEGDTHAGVFGSPGTTPAGMQHRVLSRKNNNNQGPASENPTSMIGPETANFGLPVASAEQRKTGRRG